MTNKRKSFTIFFVFLVLIGLSWFINATSYNLDLISTNITNINAGQFYSYQINTTNPNNNSLTYSLITSPSWLSVNSTTGLVTGIAPYVSSDTNYSFTVYSFTVEISDGIVQNAYNISLAVLAPTVAIITRDSETNLVPNMLFNANESFSYDVVLNNGSGNYASQPLINGNYPPSQVEVCNFHTAGCGVIGYWNALPDLGNQIGVYHIRFDFSSNRVKMTAIRPDNVTVINTFTGNSAPYSLAINTHTGNNGIMSFDFANFSLCKNNGTATCGTYDNFSTSLNSSLWNETTFHGDPLTYEHFVNTATNMYHVSQNATTILSITGDTTLSSEDSNNITIKIPKGAMISGDSSWNGTLITNLITDSTIALPSISGYTASFSKVLEIGAQNINLTLSQPAEIIIPGETGKNVGYSYDGINFVPISLCNLNVNETNLSAGGSCYYDDGANIEIWTTHFTQFMTYSEDVIVTSYSSGGGGGGYIVPAATTEAITNTSNSANTIVSNSVNTTSQTNNTQPNNNLSNKRIPITGAVIGALTSTTGVIAITFVLGASIIAVILSKRRNIKQ